MSDTVLYDARAYLDTNFEAKGIGGWRKLYLSFIEDLAPYSVVELGAGAPDFLDQIEAEHRIAVDVGQRYAEAFRSRNIRFACRDLEKDALDDLGPVDVAICSDVFEHLVNPAAALDRIAGLVGDHGVLFSHVPNEYRLGHILKVMLDRGDTAAREAAAIATAVDLEDDRRVDVAAAQEIRMQRMHLPAVDRAGSRDERLA